MEPKSLDVEESVNKTIIEGKAEILVSEKKVFYNPVQEFNRDLSVAVLSLFAKEKHDESLLIKEKSSNNANKNEKQNESENKNGISVLEALSATGLRSIRYAKEVPHIKKIIANDISEKAADSIKKNITFNKVEHLVTASHNDATILMYQSRRDRFDAIDLDPYGCPSIFLDGAVQSVSNGGLLLVTATDMAVLAGNSPETCYVKYGAVSIKSKACHELALRILLQHIAAHAGRYGRYIEPLLSISVDFYIRVFVRIRTGQIQCKDNTSKLGMVYQCTGCESMAIQPLGTKINRSYKMPASPAVDQLCKFCKHKHHMGGPIWIGLLHDQSFVSRLVDTLDNIELGTIKRIKGVLSVVQEELDIPLYYVLDRLMSIVKCDTPAMVRFRSALLHAGYNVSLSHANKLSIKTDAPTEVIWDVVRAWEKMHPAKRDRLTENSPALAILSAKSSTEITFDGHPLANPKSRKLHLTRFQVNPAPNWGPGTRSTTMINSNEAISKKIKNQNKKRHHKSRSDNNSEKTNEEKNDESIESKSSDADETPAKQSKILP
ncbi:probable tRNA (guanine(26)-N(2))-dimethyltransferase [Chelonus insularis]|uniref:probable tRNA (guanine(26)-N(2))-dimethyltransferase n=1 Tax=Chelonus insularis TaxID=460826 RepID=UPI00158ED9B2|nr:probable tRNA (guanine(26)-N(2))-dimethyltransferase [Chelonus insularis]